MKAHPDFASLHVVDHPLVRHKLSLMRDRGAPTALFRQLLKEISLLMGYEITRDLPTETRRLETPLETMDAPVLTGRKPAIVSILRAGLGMVDALHELMPGARAGHIGLYRDPETKEAREYYVKLPDAAEGRLFILCDPMLATGNSIVHAMNVLTRHGVGAECIRVMSLVAAPEGVRAFQRHFPAVPVYTAALDRGLNDHAYIMPGLGDAGDRLFGTK